MTTIIITTDRLSSAHPAHHCVPHPWTFTYLSLVLGAPRDTFCIVAKLICQLIFRGGDNSHFTVM